MSRISLVIGLADARSATPPALVYLGRSGEEMRAAMEGSPYPRHIVVPHVTGIPKNNPRAEANRAAVAARSASTRVARR
ncbi:MAG TPA: hypothetical protein VLH79_06900 [Chthonomonadales bacterium]|nr:hypothetical protein [Chthonomonadales bacterium]